MSLPELVVFSIQEANQEVRYLSFTGPQRQLRFGNEESLYSQNVPFVVEQAGSGLVHIRSVYEDRYWVRASRFEPWLVALSLQKVEDMSRDDCTLFRPQFSPGNVFVSFVHAQSGFNVAMRPAEDAHAYNLCVEQAAPAEFRFLNFSTIRKLKLPRYITIQGQNNLYLSPRSRNLPQTYLFFETQSPTNATTAFEIVYTKSGDVRIKSMSSDGLWLPLHMTDNIWYMALRPDPEMIEPNTLFEVSRSAPPGLGYEGFSLGRDGMVCYYTNLISPLQLSRRNSANSPQACLRVRQAGQQGKRKVNIDDFLPARVSRSNVPSMIYTSVFNGSSVDQEYAYPEPIHLSTSTTFSNSVSHVPGPKALFYGRIPFVAASGELELPNAATTVAADWGEVRLLPTSARLETLILPPMSETVISIYKKRAVCEVPFSYEQIDGFLSGDDLKQYLHDGSLSIDTEYNVGSETQHYPLRSGVDISQLGVEVVPGSGIFVHKSTEVPDGVEVNEAAQGSDAQGDIKAGGSDQVSSSVDSHVEEVGQSTIQDADALVGIKTDDASDQVIQE
ncbi:hypothetical protein vseg_006980 [Gypsophila vaccaria]